jgi:hypothetical protein
MSPGSKNLYPLNNYLGIISPAPELKIDRDAIITPVKHDHHAVQAGDIRTMFVQAVLLGQRTLLTGFAFQRAINDQITHPILRWG